MTGKVYGIDLGTTNSAIAVSENDEVRILKNTDGYETTPSVVFFMGGSDLGEDNTLVGLQAKNSVKLDPNNVVSFIKRYMGDNDYRVTAPSGKTYSPEMISALILRKLAQGAEQFEGEGAVRDVVITVPAYFDDARRTATKQAGAIAGLNVLRVLNEPTAAAIAFGLDSGQTGKALVYDLGGGTFDITIMDIGDHDFNVIATGGDSELGGLDFDQVIMAIIREKLEASDCYISDEDDALLADILDKSETAKIQLSNVERAISIFTVESKNHRVEITRDEFESRSEHLMQRTEFLLEEVMGNANVTWDDIDYVLAVGGSTKMPMVKKQLERLSGKEVVYKVDPDTAVARGAAIFACNLDVTGDMGNMSHGLPSIAGGLNISDVTSQSLGVITVDINTYTEQNAIIIPQNSKIPCKYSDVFFTSCDNQTSIKVEVTEGDDPDVEFVKRIGEKVLNIPPYPKQSPIEIIYAYDPDQTIYVEVIDLTAQKSLGTFEIERAANMSEEEVCLARQIVGNSTVD